MGHAHQIKRILCLVDFDLNRRFFRSPMACLLWSRYHLPSFVMCAQHVAKSLRNDGRLRRFKDSDVLIDYPHSGREHGPVGAGMQQIADWLRELGLSEYSERFVENK